jgi:hypothetical protein
MDDYAVRALLEEVAADELPPARISIELATREGRRTLRRRRVYLRGVVPLAAAAAVALLAGLLSVGGLRPQAGPAQQSLPVSAPRYFNQLAPYAGFGWLPTGFAQAGLSGQAGESSTMLTVVATAADGRQLLLTVYSAHSTWICPITIGEAERQLVADRHPVRRRQPPKPLCQHGLASGLVTATRAPDVDGARAYWSNALVTGQFGLVWEYGPGAWAELAPWMDNLNAHWPAGWRPTPGGKGPALPPLRTASLLLKVASKVRFGRGAIATYAGSKAVSYGFELTGLPAAWRPGRVDTEVAPSSSPSEFAVLDGRLANLLWKAGPASDPSALRIAVQPAGAGPAVCSFAGAPSRHLKLDGAQASLLTTDVPYNHQQSLCAPDVRGLGVFMSLDLSVPGTKDTPLPDAAQVGGLLAVLKHLHLLGPDVADWTTRPPG